VPQKGVHCCSRGTQRLAGPCPGGWPRRWRSASPRSVAGVDVALEVALQDDRVHCWNSWGGEPVLPPGCAPRVRPPRSRRRTLWRCLPAPRCPCRPLPGQRLRKRPDRGEALRHLRGQPPGQGPARRCVPREPAGTPFWGTPEFSWPSCIGGRGGSTAYGLVRKRPTLAAGSRHYCGCCFSARCWRLRRCSGLWSPTTSRSPS